MKDHDQDRATAIAIELKTLIRRYSHHSFTAHIAYMANAHVRQATGQIKLRSPVRQLMYLMSLYHATEMNGKELYTAGSDEHRKIIRLLNEIEKCYGYEAEMPKNGGMDKEAFNQMLITKATFLNYFLNATLSYVEQDIERIRRTFHHHQKFIFEETGLELSEYIDFFVLLTEMEIDRVRSYELEDHNDPVIRQLELGKDFRTLSMDQKMHLIDYADRKVYNMAIPMEDIYKRMDSQKAKMLMARFTLLRSENEDYLYYSDECPYLKKPLLIMDGKSIIMIYSKQLINAIYDFLYQLCSEENAPGRKVSERRDLYLEEKTREIFQDFFGPTATVHSGYYLHGPEKDILVLHQRNAYIIECKAHKQRTPLRDKQKAFERINDDFKKSIGKGYAQAREVEKLMLGELSFEIQDKQKKSIAKIDPKDYDEVFTIVVTQERLGQIQCDLGLLLKIDDDCPYPWAVNLNDLESFLITLKRKQQHSDRFRDFLLCRELLHGRVMCYDELELCAYFIFDNKAFVKNCTKDGIFFSQPDFNKFFDLMYRKGFGFKDELNLKEKVKRRDLHADSAVKYHKLGPADRVRAFLEDSRSDR